MDLKDYIYCICSLQDKADKQGKPKKTLFWLCTNNIDLQELCLEAIVNCYHGYKFYYTRHYVSLLQNTTLNVIVLQPFNPH